MTSKPMRNILFITWDGPETTYLEGLFLPILSGLVRFGFKAHVLQFSWGNAVLRQRREVVCARAGVPYRNVAVLRSLGAGGPLLTAWLGNRHIRNAVREWRIDTLMPRSVMPALATLRLTKREKAALRVVFDADGLAADERVDFSGMSPHSLSYRLLRDIEAEMLRQSNAILCRSQIARTILLARAGPGVNPTSVHVVSNGVDSVPFHRAMMEQIGTTHEGFVLGYCGSIGEQYRLPDMLNLAQGLRTHIHDLRFHIYTQAVERVAQELTRQGLQDADWILCKALAHDQVPEALARCDLGIAMRRPSYSMQAVSPIKTGEYLLAGLPVLGTPGIGDTAPLSEKGVFYSAETEDLEAIAHWISNDIRPRREFWRQRCHEAGMIHFSLDATVQQYRSALEFIATQGARDTE